MRIKIFGAGSIGNHMAHAFRTLDFEVSIFDNDIDALERMQNEIYPERYGGWDEQINLYSSIDSFKGYYDIVVVGTPPSSHLEIALQVINEKPKALLIEKPLTFPFDKNLNKFYEIARDSETKVFVGYNHIVSKSMQKVNEILAKHSGKTLKKIEQDTDRDNFLNADEAKSYGIIDDILDSRDDTKDGK